MDTNDISKWDLQPDVCRCCLSGSGKWDLTTAYITDVGVKEIFTNILQDCFGVSLSYLNDIESSHRVCDVCVNQLRISSSFRNQVLKADKWFSHYWRIKKDKEQNVNAILDEKKSKNECPVVENFYEDIHSSPNSELNSYSKRPIKQKQRKTNDNGNESDTPIALKNSSDTYLIDLENKHSENDLELNLTEKPTVKLKSNVKQVSERRRVILTSSIVLTETTACPFRHHKSWFQCFFCTEDFMEINLLRSHNSQIHSDVEAELKKIKRFPRSLQIEISNLECRHCDFTLTNIETMVRHFVEKHNKVIYKECIADYKVDSRPYSCHLCSKEFHVFRTLTTHLNEHYANCICDICGKPFLNSKRLKVHKRTHESGTFPCTACGKILKTKTSQTNHMETAHSKRIIKCQICFKPMKHYNDRIKHMSEVHDITNKFKCPICDREYKIKHYLATHMRQTHGNKNKKCTICGMAFITNHGLKKHMSKHTGERPFSCGICCKSYARSYTLREHMRAHENDKRLLDPP